MKWIVITSPVCFAGEVSFLQALTQAGVDAIHLRKPGASAEQMARWLEALPEAVRRLGVLHDHTALAARFGLRGVHLNRRFPAPPTGWAGRVSCSCHSLDEVGTCKATSSYVFLSPVFDSVSKVGYHAAFSPSELDGAAATGLIDERVVALGGVATQTLPQLAQWHFGGAAMLGSMAQIAARPRRQWAAALEAVRRACDQADSLWP